VPFAPCCIALGIGRRNASCWNGIVTDLENPFSSKILSMREIAEEKNKQSLSLLLGVCRTAKQMLLSLRKSVPNSPMPALWQTKLDAARKEYLAFAQQIGLTRADAEAILARELGEPVKDAPDAPSGAR
jgi:hypothetical protein